MKNTLKPLPTFEAKEKTSEPSYAKELRCAFLEGYKEARKEFQKDKERLDWIEKSDYELYEPNTDALFSESSRAAIDEAMGESKLDILAKQVKAAGLDNADYNPHNAHMKDKSGLACY